MQAGMPTLSRPTAPRRKEGVVRGQPGVRAAILRQGALNRCGLERGAGTLLSGRLHVANAILNVWLGAAMAFLLTTAHMQGTLHMLQQARHVC